MKIINSVSPELLTAPEQRDYMQRIYKTLASAPKALLVFVLLLASLQVRSVFAQTTVGPFVEFTGYSNPLRGPQAVGVGLRPTLVDLDEDGDLDLVAGEKSGNFFLRYFRNEGSATIPQFVEQTAEGNPFSDPSFAASSSPFPAFADIDNDGDVDLFMGDDAIGSTIRYFVNDGNLNFTEQVGAWNTNSKAGNPFHLLEPGDDSNQLHFVDFDNDGDLDAAIGHAFANNPADGRSFHFYTNNGEGIFTLSSAMNFGTSPLTSYGIDPVMNDVDEDDDIDLVIGNAFGSIQFFANNGANTFTEGTGAWNAIAKTGNPFHNISKSDRVCIDMADLDGDGDNDLVLGSSNGDEHFFYFKNGGNGVFTEQLNLDNPLGGIQAVNSINVVNLTNATGLEAIVGHDTDELRLYEVVSGVYKINMTHSIAAVSSINSTPVFVDLDTDGDLDLVMGFYTEEPMNANLIYRQNNNGVFIVPTASPFEALNIPFKPVPAFVDIDNDNDLDLFVGEETGTIHYYRNTGGVFTELVGPGNNPLAAIDIAALDDLDRAEINFQDLDSDGDYDLFVSDAGSASPGQISYYINTGTAAAPVFGNTASAASVINHPLRAHGITGDGGSLLSFADNDGDGDLDVFFTKTENDLRVVGYARNQNAAPVVTAPTEVVFEVGVTKSVSPALTVTDTPDDNPLSAGIDNDLIYRATVSISPFSSGNESLSITALANGMTQSFNSTTGVLTISGRSSAANYQAAFRTLNYLYQDNGTFNGAARTLTLRVLDIDRTISPSNTKQIILTPSNQIPLVTMSRTVQSYTVNTSLAIDNLLTVSDGDNTNLTSATVSISSGYISGQDILNFNNQNGITGNFNIASGILSLSGVSTVANYQAALRSITYSNQSATPTFSSRVVRFIVNDGFDPSVPRTITINYVAPNTAPQLATTTTSTTFSGAPIAIDPAIAVTDANNSIQSASIGLTGFVFGEDELVFVNQNGIAGSFDVSSGVLTLVGATTPANYEIALRSVLYKNNAANRTNTNRTVTIQVNDGTFGSNTVIFPLLVPNQAPVLASLVNSVAFTGVDIAVSSSLVVSDSDDTSLASATIAFKTNYQANEDQLVFSNQNGISGAFNSTTGILTLTGSRSIANYQTAIRSILYRNTVANKSNVTRTIEITVSDGNLTSSPFTISLQVPNQPPSLALSHSSVSLAGSNVVLDNGLAVTDTDDTNLSGATITFTSGYVAGEDNLVFINQSGISGIFNPSLRTLSLTGTASTSAYQAALRSIAYQNLQNDKTKAPRTLQISVTDESATSNPQLLTVEIANNAPTIILTQSAVNHNGTTTILDQALNVSDSDDNELASATVSLTTAFVAGEDVLIFEDQNGIAGSFDATLGKLQLTGISSKENYQMALRSVAYQNTSANRTPGVRTISFEVNDGLASSPPVSLEISIANLAPVIQAQLTSTFFLNGSLIINPTMTVADADNSQLQAASVHISGGYVGSEDVLEFNNQNGIVGEFNKVTGILSLTGSSSVANYQAALRTVQYKNTSAEPITQTRSFSYSVTDGVNNSNLFVSTMEINKPPVVAASSQGTNSGGNITFSMNEVISDPDNNLDLSTLEIISREGAEVRIENNEIIVDYGGLQDFKGTDVLTISVCDVGGQCRTQSIDITLEADIIVYNGVSPNGDNANDYFKIRFLPSQSKVSIYNRWGDIVYDLEGYDSTTKGKRFEGLNNNGNELASGTYFYKIETKDGRTLTGYLSLKR